MEEQGKENEQLRKNFGEELRKMKDLSKITDENVHDFLERNPSLVKEAAMKFIESQDLGKIVSKATDEFMSTMDSRATSKSSQVELPG